jgi:hypothetical protein
MPVIARLMKKTFKNCDIRSPEETSISDLLLKGYRGTKSCVQKKRIIRPSATTKRARAARIAAVEAGPPPTAKDDNEKRATAKTNADSSAALRNDKW